MPMPIEFATVEEAAEEFRQGRQIVRRHRRDRATPRQLLGHRSNRRVVQIAVTRVGVRSDLPATPGPG